MLARTGRRLLVRSHALLLEKRLSRLQKAWIQLRAVSKESIAEEGDAMPPPLRGLKIVDMTRVLAAPTATMLLADLGADVIKVEEIFRGDDTRQRA
jgi:hypothetical protein